MLRQAHRQLTLSSQVWQSFVAQHLTCPRECSGRQLAPSIWLRPEAALGSVPSTSAPATISGESRRTRPGLSPSMALGRLQYGGTRATYRGRHVHPLTGEARVTLDALEMRARRMAGAGKKPASPWSEGDTPAPTQRERRRQWARRIAKVFEVHPLRCHCGRTLRVIAFILDPAVTAAARAARTRSTARLRLLTRNAVPWRVRGRCAGRGEGAWAHLSGASTVGRAAIGTGPRGACQPGGRRSAIRQTRAPLRCAVCVIEFPTPRAPRGRGRPRGRR